jgi:hypothetical protein
MFHGLIVGLFYKDNISSRGKKIKLNKKGAAP